MSGAVTDDRRSDELLHDNRHCLAPAHAVLHERRLRLRHLRHDEEDSPDNGHRLRTGRRGACPGSVRRHRVRQCQLRLRRGTGRHKESVREDTHGQGDDRHRRQRRENIAYGLDREVSDEELAETARRANCYDCITAKPGGFNEDVGLGGFNFSGSQGQCISIARAMLRNADYIIVMKDGTVEAAGTPDELLKTNEYYRMFVKTL